MRASESSTAIIRVIAKRSRDETKFNRMVEFGAVLPAGLPQRKVVAAIVALLGQDLHPRRQRQNMRSRTNRTD